MILFLDFDGVLHPEPCDERDFFMHAGSLERLLSEYPEVEVVISSAWRTSFSLEKLRGFFSDDFRSRIVDKTPDLLPRVTLYAGNTTIGHREWECDTWVAENRPGQAWVALDDYLAYFRNRRQLVLCDRAVGLTDERLAVLRGRFEAARKVKNEPEVKPALVSGSLWG